MRMRSLSLLLLSALCCFPASGFAEAVYTNPISGSSIFYTTPTDACAAVIPRLQTYFAEHNDSGLTIVFTVYPGQTATYCNYNYVRSDGYEGISAAGEDSVNSEAVTDRECTVDESSTITWPLGPRDTSFPSDVNPATATVPPFPVCAAGCKVTKVSVDSCYALLDQVPQFMHCDYNVKNTGESCSTADTAPKPDTSKCPPGTVVSGSSCVADPPPDPCATDPNATGCLPPVDPCIADPNGAGCSGSGTDPGTGTGTGTGTDPGTGTGTGTGTDPGTGTGTGEPTHAASGIGCEETFACSGDSITCSIAALNKKQLCEGQKGLDKGSPDAKQAMAEAFQSTHENIEETEIHLDSIIANATNSRFLPSSCPPAQTFTVYGRQFAFKNDYFCNFATAMSWLVVSLAGLFAAVYIGKAFGGS